MWLFAIASDIPTALGRFRIRSGAKFNSRPGHVVDGASWSPILVGVPPFRLVSQGCQASVEYLCWFSVRCSAGTKMMLFMAETPPMLSFPDAFVVILFVPFSFGFEGQVAFGAAMSGRLPIAGWRLLRPLRANMSIRENGRMVMPKQPVPKLTKRAEVGRGGQSRKSSAVSNVSSIGTEEAERWGWRIVFAFACKFLVNP